VYFSYAATEDNNENISNTEVARAKLNTQQNRLTDVEVIFRAKPKVEGSNHWGSRLAFANDGTLYITLGEKFDYMEEAQNPSNHLGTVVRLNADGSVPNDNPFVGHDDKAPEIFSYGHRNPQGIAIHPVTEDIWIHEHGPKGGDEINILKSGANYGWPAVTFGRSYWGTEISDKTSVPGMEDPILHWTPSIAPSGMTFYMGDQFPEWQGDLFVGALVKRHLRRVELDGETVIAQEELLSDLNERLRDVREGPHGHLYILTDSSNGKLYRLEPR
jgi:glucose/arabinose dehydrogenase